MIKRARPDQVPKDLQDFLVSSKKEYVPIGDNIYEIYPLPVEGYFKFLAFLGKYYRIYDKYIQDHTNLSLGELLGNIFSDPEVQQALRDLLFDLFPEIEEDLKKMTANQLRYLLGVMYKQNFLSKVPPERAEIMKTIDQVLGIKLRT